MLNWVDVLAVPVHFGKAIDHHNTAHHVPSILKLSECHAHQSRGCAVIITTPHHTPIPASHSKERRKEEGMKEMDGI